MFYLQLYPTVKGKRKADYSFTSFELRVSLLHTIWGKYSKINLLAKLGMLPTSNDYKTKKKMGCNLSWLGYPLLPYQIGWLGHIAYLQTLDSSLVPFSEVVNISYFVLANKVFFIVKLSSRFLIQHIYMGSKMFVEPKYSCNPLF